MATLCKKNTEQTQRIQEEKTERKQKRTRQQKNYRRERTKKRRERITSCESSSPRPIKKSSTKRSKYLITGTIQILKSLPIPFLPNTPKDAQRD